MTPKSPRRRQWGGFAWILGVIVLAGGAQQWMARRRPPAITVRVGKVERGAVRDRVSAAAAGRVSARREATVRAEIAATIQKVHHRRGDTVRAGEPLFSYDAADLRNRMRVAQAAVVVGQAQAGQAETSADIAAKNAGRGRALVEKGVAPPAEAETLDNQVALTGKALEAARASMGETTANLRLAQGALSRAVVLAPFAGTVLATTAEEGEAIVPGAPLVTLADVSELHIDAALDESDLGRVKVGMPADVTLDAFPNAHFSGTLGEIAPSVTLDARGSRNIAVRIDLAPDERYRVGMSADVDVIVSTRENVLLVPPGALLGRGVDRAVLIAENGVAKRRPIGVGISTWEAIEVESGVQEGEEVILTLNSADLTDGSAVQVERSGVMGPKVAR